MITPTRLMKGDRGRMISRRFRAESSKHHARAVESADADLALSKTARGGNATQRFVAGARAQTVAANVNIQKKFSRAGSGKLERLKRATPE